MNATREGDWTMSRMPEDKPKSGRGERSDRFHRRRIVRIIYGFWRRLPDLNRGSRFCRRVTSQTRHRLRPNVKRLVLGAGRTNTTAYTSVQRY